MKLLLISCWHQFSIRNSDFDLYLIIQVLGMSRSVSCRGVRTIKKSYFQIQPIKANDGNPVLGKEEG